MFNWARSVKIGDTSQIFKPKSETELVTFLAQNKAKIRVLGSGMTFNGIVAAASAESILLDLSSPAFVGLKEMEQGKLATFGSCTTLEQIASDLRDRDLQLTSCPGVLLTQTIAGALATGTHGQGLANAGLFDSVSELRVALADGTIQQITKKTQPDLFSAFKIHLGCLGIILSVRLECEPLVCYRVTKEVTDFNHLVQNFQIWNETSSHCKAWWFPNTDHVQLWRTWPATKAERSSYLQNGSKLMKIDPDKDSCIEESDGEDGRGRNEGGLLSKAFRRSIDDLLNILKEDTSQDQNNIQNNIQKQDQKQDQKVHEARFQTITRFRSLESCVGNVYQIWCKGIPAPQVNCELAVPFSSLPDVLTRLREYYSERKAKDALEMHYPFILRATGPTDAWLSPANGERVCWIGFLVYMSEHQVDQKSNTDKLGFQYSPEKLDLLRDIESVLAGLHPRCLPHYGKFYTPSQYLPLASRLEHWNAFKNLVRTIDPQGIFRNAYLEDLLQLD